jgi:quercetin dioxygenase-like cupin family protein
MIKKKKNTIPGARVFSLSDCAGYEENAIVSRSLIAKPCGNVTVFSFDKSEGLSEHIAPFDALVCVLEGSVSVKINKKPFVLNKGEAIILPAGKPHSLKAITKFKMMLVMVKK